MKKKDLERLKRLEVRIREICEDMGLLTTDIMFEIVPAQRVLEGMSYNFPTNFSHWSFGRDFERNRTIYEHTGHGIAYEQVWNFDVPKAFLVETNPFALNVLILAHVYGHVDFFLSNRYCQHGRSFADIADEARNAAGRFQGYTGRYGLDEVEQIIDAGMSIQWHQDLDPFAQEVPEEELRERLIAIERARIERPKTVGGEFRKPQTPEEIKAIEKGLRELMFRTPPQAEYDLLRYIKAHSPKPLRPMAVDILSVIRNQARALSPNGRTKLLNEGWATYVHVHVMRQLFDEGLLTPEEHGVFNRFHSGVLRENKKSLNWYRVGFGIYEYVKEQWDRGRFGKEFEECEDPHKRAYWDTKAGLGEEKIFEVRAHCSDRMAVELYFRDEFIHEQALYIYQEKVDQETGEILDVVVESRPEVIRTILKRSMTLYGTPIIYVKDGNYKDNRELYLVHVTDSKTFSELNPRYERGALEKIHFLWGRPVHIETIEIIEGEPPSVRRILDTYDGKQHKSKAI
ncbi:MAG: SpoVR family protein [Candidatus Spechtbacterales bacterium]